MRRRSFCASLLGGLLFGLSGCIETPQIDSETEGKTSFNQQESELVLRNKSKEQVNVSVNILNQEGAVYRNSLIIRPESRKEIFDFSSVESGKKFVIDVGFRGVNKKLEYSTGNCESDPSIIITEEETVLLTKNERECA